MQISIANTGKSEIQELSQAKQGAWRAIKPRTSLNRAFGGVTDLFPLLLGGDGSGCLCSPPRPPPQSAAAAAEEEAELFLRDWNMLYSVLGLRVTDRRPKTDETEWNKFTLDL